MNGNLKTVLHTFIGFAEAFGCEDEDWSLCCGGARCGRQLETTDHPLVPWALMEGTVEVLKSPLCTKGGGAKTECGKGSRRLPGRHMERNPSRRRAMCKHVEAELIVI